MAKNLYGDDLALDPGVVADLNKIPLADLPDALVDALAGLAGSPNGPESEVAVLTRIVRSHRDLLATITETDPPLWFYIAALETALVWEFG